MNTDKKKSARSKVNWMAGALNPAHKGMLHKNLGIPMGTKIPGARLAAAAKEPGKVGKRARLALTMRKMNG